MDANTAELVEEVEWQQQQLLVAEARVELLSAAFSQTSSLFFHAIKAFRSYSSELEGVAGGSPSFHALEAIRCGSGKYALTCLQTALSHQGTLHFALSSAGLDSVVQQSLQQPLLPELAASPTAPGFDEQLHALHASRQALSGELADARGRCEQLALDLEAAKTTAGASLIAEADRHAAALEVLSRNLAQKQEEITALQTAVGKAQLESESLRAELQQAREQAQALSQSRTLNETRAQTVQDDLQEQLSLVFRAVTQLSLVAPPKAPQSCAEAVEQVHSAAALVATLQAQSHTMSSANERLQSLCGREAGLQQRVSLLESEAVVLRGQLSTATAAVSASAGIGGSLDRATAQLDEMQRVAHTRLHARMEAEISTLEETTRKLRAHNTALVDENNNLTALLGRIENTLKLDNAAHESALAALRDRLSESDVTRRQQVLQLETQAQARTFTHTREKDELERVLVQADAQRAQQVHQLQSELHTAHSDAKQYCQEVQLLVQQLDECQAGLEEERGATLQLQQMYQMLQARFCEERRLRVQTCVKATAAVLALEQRLLLLSDRVYKGHCALSDAGQDMVR